MLYVLLIVLLLIAILGLPQWPYAAGWGFGYYPSGIIIFIFLVMLILMAAGRL